jgi:hypothetical protein
MTHQEIENLASDYLEGVLSIAERSQVDSHLAGCAECREMIADLGQVLQVCQLAEDAEPSPWLVAKIMRATAGRRQTSWIQQLKEMFRPVLQPRVVYSVAMAIFAFSFIINAAGVNLREVRWNDLTPGAVTSRASRQGHLLAARAEKYYFDLRLVYEIETRFRKLNNQNKIEAVPKPDAPEGGAADGSPVDPTSASNEFILNNLIRRQFAPSLHDVEGSAQL